MKVKILQSTVAKKQNVKVGEIHDLEPAEAAILIRGKKAQIHDESEEDSDEKPKTKGSGKSKKGEEE